MSRELTYDVLQEARDRRDPAYGALFVEYLALPDPAENAPEDPTAEEAKVRLSRDAFTMTKLRAGQVRNKWGKSKAEIRRIRTEAWEAIGAAKFPPPRLKLHTTLLELYEANDEWSRATLRHVLKHGRIGWGMWKGMKTIYKLAEERHDAEMFGLLTWRFDDVYSTQMIHGEVTPATFAYLKRRAWRYLRDVGRTVPELYPLFAVEVLKHYRNKRYYWGGTWVAGRIFNYGAYMKNRWLPSGIPDDMASRSYPDTWDLDEAPLLRLLEQAENDDVCEFAIRGLRHGFPKSLEDVSPEWLARIGERPLPKVQRFVVSLLEQNPKFHLSKLKGLGLHELVVGYLLSSDSDVSTYAVEYARQYATDLDLDRLVELMLKGNAKVIEFAKARLEKLTPKDIGLDRLIRMLGARGATYEFAKAKFRAGFSPADLTKDQYVALRLSGNAQTKVLEEFYREAKVEVPAPYLVALAESDRVNSWQRRNILQQLQKRSPSEIGVEWIKAAVMNPRYANEVRGWILRGMFKPTEIDVEWLKGLVMRGSTRSFALSILGNSKLVVPRDVGFAWLITMARQADLTLSQFGQNHLMRFFEPADFGSDLASGIEKLWSLTAASQPDAVRQFTANYLMAHHPQLGPSTEPGRTYGITPALTSEAYPFTRIRPFFEDAQPALRRMAQMIGRFELISWDPAFVYDLASSKYAEGRKLAAQALLKIGDADADPRLVPPASWLTAPRVFGLAESRMKATREIALTLIRRHYKALGGAEKLAWLMESPDREVRLFAVRLLWDQHRPLPLGVAREEEQRFESRDALQHFLRTILFGLPPGRMERREGFGDALPDRALPASVAKRRLVEVVRDMSVLSSDFAEIAVPVLVEFMESQALGEWQACAAALARIRAAHPTVYPDVLPPALEPQTPAPAGAALNAAGGDA